LENPLNKFFPVENRPEGVFIKVSPEHRSKVQIAEIRNCLFQEFVTNFDINKIKEIVDAAKDVFEKAGPLFEIYNQELDRYVDINVSPMQAGVTVSSVAISNDIKVTDTALVFCLRRKGIVHGINFDRIRDLVKNGQYDHEVVIAKVRLP